MANLMSAASMLNSIGLPQTLNNVCYQANIVSGTSVVTTVQFAQTSIVSTGLLINVTNAAGGYTNLGWYQQPEPTPEEMEAHRAYVEERKKASEKGLRLLKMLLDARQLEQFEKDSFFELEVNDRLYSIAPGRRVMRLNKDTKQVESYFCIHPDHNNPVPPEDVAVSQKLLLEANEAEFLRLANETKAA